MFIFAFPGMGKTTLAKCDSRVVDLEMSDIKYDNSYVSHLTKEERKSVSRPIKDKNYKQIYIQKATELHQEGKIVLVSLTFLFRMLLTVIIREQVPFHIYIFHTLLSKKNTASGIYVVEIMHASF